MRASGNIFVLLFSKPALVHYKPTTVYLGGDSLECSWIGFLEKESEVSYYTFDVGTTEGDDSVYASAHLEAGTCAHRATGKYFDNVLFMYVDLFLSYVFRTKK